MEPVIFFTMISLTAVFTLLLMYLFGGEDINFIKFLFWKDFSSQEAFDIANKKLIKKQSKVYRRAINYIRSKSKQGKTTCNLMENYGFLYHSFGDNETLAKYVAKRLKLEGYVVNLDLFEYIGGVRNFHVSWSKPQ